MGRIIGIDLGTAHSCVAIVENGQPKVIPNAEGAITIPSVVGFHAEAALPQVGAPALRQAAIQPRTTVAGIKRFMGMSATDWGRERCRVPYLLDRNNQAEYGSQAMEFAPTDMGRDHGWLLPYRVEATAKGRCVISILDRLYAPEQISAIILSKLKESAEAYLGEKVSQAVITVPAHFNDDQRQATKNACAIAGLEAMRIIVAPSAAALARAMDRKLDRTIAIFDLGAGGCSISILDVSEGVVEVRSTYGENQIGGQAMDRLIADWLAAEFHQKEGIDLRDQLGARERILEAAEQARCELSSCTQVEIYLPFITTDASGPRHITETLTRARFEAMLEHILEELEATCRHALIDAGLRADEIQDVFLVGGVTRTPMVRAMIKSTFGQEPNQSLNPDEAVALGAAVEGEVLSGQVKGILLMDSTSLSLGVNACGGEMNVIIPRNTTIPTKRSEVYTTAKDNQTEVVIEVFQGDRPLARNNKRLGNFHLGGLPPAPRGVPQIEVIFDIDTNGIVHVMARDQVSIHPQSTG